MDKYFMWIHYERLRNHNKAKHNKTVCIFLEIYCISSTLAELHWLAIKQHIDFKILLYINKQLNGQAPTYLADLLVLYKLRKNLRSAS